MSRFVIVEDTDEESILINIDSICSMSKCDDNYYNVNLNGNYTYILNRKEFLKICKKLKVKL